jgi:formate dehydrogenase (NADP+) beta subunit
MAPVTWPGHRQSDNESAARVPRNQREPSDGSRREELNGSKLSDQAKRYPLPLAHSALPSLVPCSHNGCPLGVDAPAIANALLAGDHPRAFLLARAPNPFASACGHGCHAPCETACHRRAFGAPVAIAALEAYATGFSTPATLPAPEPCTSAHDSRSVSALVGLTPDTAARAPRSGKHVAIIGAGVAGLGCAHDLALLGHESTLFDAASEPGGVLTGALPSFRFPVASARAECAAILAMHATLASGSPVAGIETLRAMLATEFDAIFLATGASSPAEQVFAGQPPHSRVVDAMAVLAHQPPLSGRVVVLGDGDLALDAARVALRRPRSEEARPVTGAHVVLPRSLQEALAPPAALAAALHDGVELHGGWIAHRYLMDAGGTLTGVEIVHAGDGITKVLACDWLVTAAPRVPARQFGPELRHDERGFIAVDPMTLRTSLRGVWAGGACAFGHRSIAHAVADGKKAAWQIHAALTKTTVRVAVSSAWVEVDDWDGARAPRAIAARRSDLAASTAPPADPFSSSALRDVQEIVREASRCFDCTVLPVVSDGCTQCGKCVSGCPEHAITMASDGATDGTRDEPRTVVVDPSLCTRCGLCVEICPPGAISMARAIWEERLVAEAAPAPEGRRQRPRRPPSYTPPDIGGLPAVRI